MSQMAVFNLNATLKLHSFRICTCHKMAVNQWKLITLNSAPGISALPQHTSFRMRIGSVAPTEEFGTSFTQFTSNVSRMF